VSLILALLLAQPASMNLNLAPIDARDEGTRLSTRRSYAIDCTGAGITCSADGGIMTLVVPGGGSGGGGGGGGSVDGGVSASVGSPFAVWQADGTLTASRVITAGSNIAISTATAGQVGIAVTGTVPSATTADTATAFAATPAACPGGQYASAQSASGVLTCSTPPGTGVTAVTASAPLSSSGGTAPNLTLGTVGAANGGFGAAQPTCSAGQFVTCTGTTCSCSTPAGTGSGPNLGTATIAFADGVVSASYAAEVTVAATWVTATSNIVLTPACARTSAPSTVQECFLAQIECSVTTLTVGVSFGITCTAEGGAYGTFLVSYSGV